MPRRASAASTENHYYVGEPPVTEEEEQQWVSRIVKKFTKAELLKKLQSVGSGVKAGTKAKLAGALLTTIKAKLDAVMDGDAQASGSDEEGVDDDDEPYDPTDDPAYRSALDGDLDELEDDEDEDEDGDLDPEMYVHDEEEANEAKDENEWVLMMRRRLGLTASGGSEFFISSWRDPTLIFLASTLLSVLFVRGDAATKSLHVVDTLDEFLGRAHRHFVDPAFAAGALYLFAAFKLAGGKAALAAGRYSLAERLAAGWYLWNGAIVHVMMDGMAGGPNGGWGLKLMHENYAILDRRFDESAIASGAAPEGDVAIATVVTQTELLCHSLLCLAAYVGIVKRKGWADGVGLVALSFQLFGAIMFVVPDLMTECKNMVPRDVDGCVPGFSLFEIFYFWFGVVVNVVWVIVPGVMIWNTWNSHA